MSGIQQLLMAGGQAPKVLEYLSVQLDNVDRTTYTFSGVSIGTASSDRRIIVTVGNTNTTLISSATVGGVSATIIVQRVSGGGNAFAGVLIANVPTGTTADIVITFAAGVSNCKAGVYSSTGLLSDTATDTGFSDSNPGSDTLTVIPGGFCVGACSMLDFALASPSWTALTVHYSEEQENGVSSGASTSLISGTSISPSVDYQTAGTTCTVVFATF